MSNWLFPAFLEDDNAYTEAQAFWCDLWRRILQQAATEEEWETNWMVNPDRDGNPIFTAVCNKLNRGVRIIREQPADPDDIELDWWIDYFGEESSPEAIRELVITCALSEGNLSTIERLIRQWVEEEKAPASKAVEHDGSPIDKKHPRS